MQRGQSHLGTEPAALVVASQPRPGFETARRSGNPSTTRPVAPTTRPFSITARLMSQLSTLTFRPGSATSTGSSSGRVPLRSTSVHGRHERHEVTVVDAAQPPTRPAASPSASSMYRTVIRGVVNCEIEQRPMQMRHVVHLADSAYPHGGGFHTCRAGVVRRRHRFGPDRARSQAVVRRYQPRLVDRRHPDPLLAPRQSLLPGAALGRGDRPPDRPRCRNDRRRSGST